MNKSWRNVVIGEEEKKSANEAKTVKIPVAAENDKKRYERLLVVYAPLVGQRVTVFLYDGAIFEGTLDSFQTDPNEFSLILRMATMLRPGREVIDATIKAGVTFELMNIRFDDMAELKSSGDKSDRSDKSGGIGTDSAISKKKNSSDLGKERELHRWQPEMAPSADSLTFGTGSSSTNWDQFATNEKLFGLKTDFREDLYTTTLDRNSPHIRAHEAKAERIAKEIMGTAAGGNVHLAEERGQWTNQEADEEMLYGAVVRSDSSASQQLPPGFPSTTANESTEPSSSSLNPSAPEFKLNIDAPEFKPSSAKVTYYNQPRRNLNYGNNPYANQYVPGYYYNMNHPASVPYYYAPPPLQQQQQQQQLSPPQQSNPSSEMNPDAADFVMPSSNSAYGGYYGGYEQYGAYHPNSSYNGDA
jgi:hypothetical protein